MSWSLSGLKVPLVIPGLTTGDGGGLSMWACLPLPLRITVSQLLTVIGSATGLRGTRRDALTNQLCGQRFHDMEVTVSG